MTGAVLAWPRRPEPRAGWTNDELAELYRVEHALKQAAFAVDTDRGISDEGDPWFVFCHIDGGVVVHLTRMDGLYYLYCVTLPNPLVASSFATLTKAYIASLPIPQSTLRAGGVVAHPSALLSLLVAAAMLSVDALVQHSAHAADLSAALHRDFLPGDYSGIGAAKAGVVQTFNATLMTAVWRQGDADDLETGGAWRTVEQAALGFAALCEAVPVVEPSEKAALVETSASAQDASQSLADDAFPIGGEGGGGSRAWGDSSGDIDAGSCGPSGGAVVAAADSTLALANIQMALIAEISGEANVGGEELGAIQWRSGSLAGSVRTVGSEGDAATTTYTGAKNLTSIFAEFEDLNVILAPDGGSLDLMQGAGALRLVVSGRGELSLFHAEFAKSIDVLEGTTADVRLFYDATSSATPVSQRLRLGGETEVSLAGLSPTAQPASLLVNSQGARANNLNILDTTPSQAADLKIKIVGNENLHLQESAQTFAASHLNAGALTGKLTVGIDLGAGPTTLTNLDVGSGNFIVTPQDSIALENLINNATIELGVDLNSAIFGFAGGVHSDAAQIALKLELGTPGPSPPVSIGLISAEGVDNLSITSSGDSNAVQTIIDAELTNLQLTGNGALEIGAIVGIGAAHHQNVLIDAGGLAGFLTLNASMIADMAAGGRQVSIILGAGGGAVTDTSVTESLTVTIGAGQAVLNIADGVTHIAVAGLKSTDHVNVGGATVADAFINGLALGSAQQDSIDAAANLLFAATKAATLAGSTVAHQAVLFSYQGDSYVFVDAVGNHLFNSSLDAIVKLTGFASTTDMAGAFHSS